MAKTVQRKLIEQLAVGAAIGGILGFGLRRMGWHPPSLWAGNVNHFDYNVEWNRVSPALILWLIFTLYWTIASRNSAPTRSSESRKSTYFHH
ncbi:MAG: hypothetical protein LAP21_06670 [Acidobacteriia bacterium]|nr:hypothetical protein [Terriglobia bacterium]